jgi:uncharacterized membrane protein YbhN (UPF0104 family)
MKASFKKVGKPLAGLLLLCGILYQLDLRRLLEISRGIDYGWVGLGFICLVLSNYFSALRWQKISEILGIRISSSRAVVTYAQGITANTVLPGGILGGDLWRTLALVSIGANKSTALMTVILDRLSGVWMLSGFSFVAILLQIYLKALPTDTSVAWLMLYSLFALLLIFTPYFFSLFRPQAVSVFLKTAFLSILVQVLALTAFVSCLYAITPEFSLIGLVAVSMGIFVAAALPFAIGGFGAREFGAVMFLALLGLSSEEGFLASALYGLLGTVQGLLSTYFWLNRRQYVAEVKP